MRIYYIFIPILISLLLINVVYGEDVEDILLSLEDLNENELLNLLEKVNKDYPAQNTTEVIPKISSNLTNPSAGQIQSQSQSVINEIHNHYHYNLVLANGTISQLPSLSFPLEVHNILSVLSGDNKLPGSSNGNQTIQLSDKSPPISITKGDGVYSCGDTSYGLTTNFVNPLYPKSSKVLRSCSFLLKVERGVKQVRVDLVDTHLGSPVGGECGKKGAYLMIRGTAFPLGVDKFCGINKGQHFYIEIDNVQESPYIEFIIEPTYSLDDRDSPFRWGLWITQVLPGSQLSAPRGCFQYYFKEMDNILSFNFEGSQYFNNQYYRICITARRNQCFVTFSSKDGEFGLEKFGNYKTVPFNLSGKGKFCERDYLRIPDSYGQNGPQTDDRYCGGRLNPLHGSSSSSPVKAPFHGSLYTLDVRTGSAGGIENFINEHHSPGFRLLYELGSGGCQTADMSVLGTYNKGKK